MNKLLRILGLGLSSCSLPLAISARKGRNYSDSEGPEKRYAAYADVGAHRYYERRPSWGWD